MKKNIFIITTVCLLLAVLFVIQISAVEPRNYFTGCIECKAVVTAYCTGAYSGSPYARTHKYGFLWLKECNYVEHIHSTMEHCNSNSTHINPGSDVHSTRQHECGDPGEGADPCPIGGYAYTSENH